MAYVTAVRLQIAYGLVCCYTWAHLRLLEELSNSSFIHLMTPVRSLCTGTHSDEVGASHRTFVGSWSAGAVSPQPATHRLGSVCGARSIALGMMSFFFPIPPPRNAGGFEKRKEEWWWVTYFALRSWFQFPRGKQRVLARQLLWFCCDGAFVFCRR